MEALIVTPLPVPGLARRRESPASPLYETAPTLKGSCHFCSPDSLSSSASVPRIIRNQPRLLNISSLAVSESPAGPRLASAPLSRQGVASSEFRTPLPFSNTYNLTLTGDDLIRDRRGERHLLVVELAPKPEQRRPVSYASHSGSRWQVQGSYVLPLACIWCLSGRRPPGRHIGCERDSNTPLTNY